MHTHCLQHVACTMSPAREVSVRPCQVYHRDILWMSDHKQVVVSHLSVIAACLSAEELLLQALHHMQQLLHRCWVWTTVPCHTNPVD